MFCTGCSRGAKVTFTQGDNKIDIRIDGTSVAEYRYTSDLVKPVLYPIRTLNGVIITRHFPFEEVEGESHDHPHHTGVFFTYDEVNGNRFWASTSSPPQIRHINIADMRDGKREGTLSSVSHWTAKNGQILLEEQRTMAVYPGVNEYAIDFIIKITAVDTTVVFGSTKEGMFAIRVAPWLKENGGNGKYLSSRGGTTAADIWARRAEWVRLEGEKDGIKAGIAIMNHPSSTNFPTFWHARDYGLFSANPLGQTFFQKSRGEENPEPYELTLQKGESTIFRFQMICYDGTRNKEEMEQKFRVYSGRQ